ncbi:MAG: MmgE/PrpD family protein [Gracilibacteraceae bacterium]|jgi:2-methylcitrate dehydratase PrpD|nr:MmgE/PrpD family protein [Gracilibacteraceae bacterium]
MDAIYLYAQTFHDAKFSDLSEKVAEITKLQVLDYFGVGLGGATQRGVPELVALNREWGGAPQCTTLYYGDKVPAPNAAQVNVTMCHTLDFDDVHEAAIMHPGVVAIPTALTMAEYVRGISGEEFMTAIALGTDMICRLGLATRPGESIIPYGWHQTTLYGAITAAAVAGRILKLDVDTILNAIGIAYHRSSGNAQPVKDGALTKRLGPGFAVKAGIESALMAQKGLTGARNVLEGDAGFYKVYHDNKYSRETLVNDLGKFFETENVSIKPYPCCRGIHPFIDAALQIKSQKTFTPDDIAQIQLWCGPGTLDLLCAPHEFKTAPRNYVDSQFSAPWGVTSVFVRGGATINDFSPAAIKDPALLALAARIKPTLVDESFAGMEIEAGRVEVAFSDGSKLTEQVNLPKGTPTNPLNFADVEEKFHGCLSILPEPLPEENVAKLIEMIKSLDKCQDVTTLIPLTLRREGRL